MRRHVIVFMLLAGALAQAAPRVEIKAKTRLQLSKVKLRGADQVEVWGQLVDGLTGEGIVGQSVAVTVDGVTEGALTQAPDGAFHAIVASQPGPAHVELAFGGAYLLDKTDVAADTDPTKQEVELLIRTDPVAGGVAVLVTATGDDGPLDLPIALAIAPQGTDDFRALPGITANAPAFTLSRAAAGGAGTYRLRAAFAGDDRVQSATREALIELTSQTRTTLAVASTRLAYEDDLVASGRVVDDDGNPVAGARVTLASNHVLEEGTTDADGHYRFRVEAEHIAADARGSNELARTAGASPGATAEQTFVVQTSAEPNGTAVESSRSPAVELTIAAPRPVPVSFTVAAFVATGLAAAAFFVARRRPWQRAGRPVVVEPPEVDPSPVAGGLVTARTGGLVSALRRPTDAGFTGTVRDTVRRRPIAGATLRLVLGEASRAATTDAEGAFAFEDLPAGSWRAEVAAPGHVTERFAVEVPHHGHLRDARVDLVPVRERVFQLYRRAAEPSLPEPRLWGVWSPRQIVDHVRGKQPAPKLAALTDFVEEIYFGPRATGEAVLETAAQRVDLAIAERGRGERDLRTGAAGAAPASRSTDGGKSFPPSERGEPRT